MRNAREAIEQQAERKAPGGSWVSLEADASARR